MAKILNENTIKQIVENVLSNLIESQNKKKDRLKKNQITVERIVSFLDYAKYNYMNVNSNGQDNTLNLYYSDWWGIGYEICIWFNIDYSITPYWGGDYYSPPEGGEVEIHDMTPVEIEFFKDDIKVARFGVEKETPIYTKTKELLDNYWGKIYDKFAEVAEEYDDSDFRYDSWRDSHL